ncbi:RNA polymerase III RPC4-domain-containing protein [Thamnocephalis sphaerospora]|uniref:RNA polymerase III RPC4-domain-containing protein n=1 Tax=Thamnocephalis sphaerospora TaxID=78915 RepID=A0A4P9XPE0_9FUNG|nr:RNA polymerase III RPC4-domain-containing protein [Thamnocephalis sphaerospora]|eukprot:RKP07865.1 RNA polymerase III RPC4-domain-containing protein [Thamnocephalis sphaerospora]
MADAGDQKNSDAGTPAGRLPPLRPGKDYTLGGKQKTKFMPTVPTKRNKKEAATTSEQAGNRGERGRGRGRGGRGGRGGGAGRGRGGLLDQPATATGFLAMGPSNLAGSRMGRAAAAGAGGGFGSSSSGLAGSSSVGAMADFDAAMSAGTARFTPDLWAPVAYDAYRPAGAGRGRRTRGHAVKEEGAIKAEAATADVHMSTEGLSVKAEPQDDAMTAEQLLQTTAEDDTLVKLEEDEDDAETESDTRPVPLPAADLLYPRFRDDTMEFPRNSAGEESLFFFQLPTVMPEFERPPAAVHVMDVDEDSTKQGPDAADKDALPPIKAEPQDAPVKQENDTEQTPQAQSTPSHALEGRVGKLVVYKSGRMSLWLGDIEMEVTSGASCAFPQEIVAINTVQKTVGVLGTVASRFVCTPEMATMLDEDADMDHTGSF